MRNKYLLTVQYQIYLADKLYIDLTKYITPKMTYQKIKWIRKALCYGITLSNEETNNINWRLLKKRVRKYLANSPFNKKQLQKITKAKNLGLKHEALANPEYNHKVMDLMIDLLLENKDISLLLDNSLSYKKALLVYDCIINDINLSSYDISSCSYSELFALKTRLEDTKFGKINSEDEALPVWPLILIILLPFPFIFCDLIRYISCI